MATGEGNWNERAVFLEALALPKENRDQFLDHACPDDAARDRIRTLLRHHGEAEDDFLKISAGAVSESTPHPVQIDEFRILHRLGEGGMGVVYLAEDTILGRKVALKVLAGQLSGSEQALARFREEARNAAVLKHPAIVPVFKFGRGGGHDYLITEYVDGPNLASIIAEKRQSFKSLATQDVRAWHRRAAEIIAIVSDALDCAHRANIVHRDIKPSNILLDRERGPRLADFGIAKHLVEEDRTQTRLVGSCHYMSPEQADIAGKQVDQRSDIFSIGVVLYEMLSLRLPFDGNTMHLVLRAVTECNPSRLRTIDRRIPLDLETICHKALEKRPQDRYQTAAHVAADLRCFLRGDPILARRPTLTRRIARFAQKRGGYILTTLVAGLVALATGIVWRQVIQDRARLCTVDFACDQADTRLYISPIDRATYEPAPRRDMGRLPRAVSIEPGLYRIVAVSGQGAFTEATVLLRQPGRAKSIKLDLSPHASSPPDMAYFEGGTTTCGAAGRSGLSQPRRVVVRPFFMDQREVSNAEYRSFVNAMGRSGPVYWQSPGYESLLENRPVVGIAWEDANEYCRFVGKRLPTATEWEHAMRWPDDRILPWGASSPPAVSAPTRESVERATAGTFASSFDEYRAHVNDVGSMPELRSAAGLFHGAGNVSEFTESVITSSSVQVIVKGAAWTSQPEYFDSAAVRTQPLETFDADGTVRPAWSMTVGFRCACSAQP